MNPAVKKLWVAALRSGDYVQGRGRLRNADYSFCCLGVLCNLHAQAHPEIAKTQHSRSHYLNSSIYLPEQVMAWAGLKRNDGDAVRINRVYRELAQHNDVGCTFVQ